MSVYPLIFEPIFKRRVWGGRRLETTIGKPLPPDEPIGESWEIADLEADQTRVANGPARGKTLQALMAEWGGDLLGRAASVDGRFPLLLKFLDARETLSVQVHPSAAMARDRGGAVRVKNEAWYVIDAEPGSIIYRGLKRGVDADALREAIRLARVEEVLQRVPVRKGHCYYLPSGMIHALGAGVLVAEIQTPADMTYRVYDWDRVDAATGQPRELHVDDALEAVSFEPPPETAEQRSHVASVWTAVTQLVRCADFVIERVRMVAGVEQGIPYEELVIWMVLEGTGQLWYDGPGSPQRFGRGDTVLLPAALKDGRVSIDEATMWLEVTVPIASSLADFERPAREDLAAPAFGAGGLVELNVPRKDEKRKEAGEKKPGT